MTPKRFKSWLDGLLAVMIALLLFLVLFAIIYTVDIHT